MAAHDRVPDEIPWLARAGLEEGAPADVVAYPADPRRDLAVLDHPSRIVLRGRIVR